MNKRFNGIYGKNNPGFFYGYVIAASAFCLQALSLGMFNSFGVFINPLMNEFEWYGSYGIFFMALAGISFMGLLATLTLKPVAIRRSSSHGI
ncbi:hypothetical protein ACFL1N_12070 [Thermodesulfobacteriota bacterium]